MAWGLGRDKQAWGLREWVVEMGLGRGRGLGLGAADSRAVLAAAWPRDLVHRLVTALGGIVHGLHPMGRKICRKEC